MDETPVSRQIFANMSLEERLQLFMFYQIREIPYYPHTITFPEYPDILFVIMSRVEPFQLNAQDTPEDLRALGWIAGEETDNVFLIAGGQFARIVNGAKNLTTFFANYIQEADLHYAEQYPVLLVNPIPPRKPYRLEEGSSIGTNGLVFHEGKIHRYTLQHLSEAGLPYHQIPSQSIQYYLPDPLPDPGYPGSLGHDNDPLLRYWRERREAAKEFAKLYWQYHQQQRQTKLQPSLSDVPSVNVNGFFSIPSHIALQGILGAYSNAQSGAVKWKNLEQQRLAYLYSRSGNVAQVELRPTKPPAPTPADTTDTMMESVLQQVRALSDLDGDVLLAVLAQWMAAPRDKDGYIWITVDRILEYRGIQPRTFIISDNTEHAATHRKEAIEKIGTSMEHIRDTHVTVRQWVKEERPAGKRGRPKKQVLQLQSYILSITHFLRQQELSEEVTTDSMDPTENLAVSWRCRPGECLEGFLEGQDYLVAELLQQTLSYDPYHEQWEKRLARYFTFHEELSKGGKIICVIRDLFAELSLTSKSDQHDPQRIKKHFDRAMNRLQKDGQLSIWQYQEDENQLPSHKWLELWMNFHIEVMARSFNQILPQKRRK